MVPTSGPPTVETIAARAGVSTASVSRVLNGHGARPETVRRVERAAAELGYVPNAVARSLQGGRSRQLTVAVGDFGDPGHVAMVRAVQAVARAHGYRLVLHSTDTPDAPDAADDELDVLRGLADGTSDGLVLCPVHVTPEHVEALRAAAQPVVVLGAFPDGVEPPADSVRDDPAAGAELAVRHLARTGRRRVAFLDGPAGTAPGRARHRGYRAALADRGLAPDPALVAHADTTVEAGTRALHRLLDGPAGGGGRTGDEHGGGVDAVLCADDRLALGATHALHARGLRVPADVAVAGMGDSPLAGAGWPPLTSVDLGAAERARIAAEMLLARVAERDAGTARTPARTATVAPRLAVRASSAPPAPGARPPGVAP
ncbi:LacI family DNA-binding transcriptional regulator [Streptomyces sp. NPDC054784]